MTLPAGTNVGPYEIVAQDRRRRHGRGVSRARCRSSDATSRSRCCPRRSRPIPSACARFEREARMLASLNHPHIGAIYGLEDGDGVRALVLELVEGDDAGASAIARRRRLPTRRSARRSRAQIADALDAAHEQRHRPSRSEAREHQDHAGRRGEGARLRAGEGDRPADASGAGLSRRRRR